MNTRNNQIPSAQLWIGPEKDLFERAEHFLQRQFCPYDACGSCSTCRLIHEQQFHSTIWLYPEKRYTLEQIKIIFNTISFSHTGEQPFFFIIQKADCLSTVCSNSLLKSVEEPPKGYHFIFLAERKDLILPTIQSRCTISTYQTSTTEHKKEKLLYFLKEASINRPAEFTKALDTLKPNEQESAELLNNLFNYWMNCTKKAIIKNDKVLLANAQRKLNIIKNALLKPAMPGSSKIFWKDLFLMMS